MKWYAVMEQLWKLRRAFVFGQDYVEVSLQTFCFSGFNAGRCVACVADVLL